MMVTCLEFPGAIFHCEKERKKKKMPMDWSNEVFINDHLDTW